LKIKVEMQGEEYRGKNWIISGLIFGLIMFVINGIVIPLIMKNSIVVK